MCVSQIFAPWTLSPDFEVRTFSTCFVMGKVSTDYFAEYEVNLIRLLDKLTNGSKIVVTETGTCVYFQPGILVGGVFEHECCVQRAIGYYLEVLLSIGPFCKKPLHCVLKGVTNNKVIYWLNNFLLK